MDLEIEEYPLVTVVKFIGKTIEAGSVEKLKKAILPIAESNTNLIFDMSSIRFIDSMGCGVLLFADRKLKQKGGRLSICGSSPQVTALFDMLGFRNFLGIFDSKEEAVKSFR